MASRRKARETVLKVLYMCESRDLTVDEAFAEMESIDREIKNNAGDTDALNLKPFALGFSGKQKEFALSLARTIECSKDTLNEHIKAVLKNWDFERVSRIDRMIMWIAISEMKVMLDIPSIVSVNEAIELAKKFSSSKSPAFVNGVLDAVARNMGIIKNNKTEKAT